MTKNLGQKHMNIKITVATFAIVLLLFGGTREVKAGEDYFADAQQKLIEGYGFWYLHKEENISKIYDGKVYIMTETQSKLQRDGSYYVFSIVCYQPNSREAFALFTVSKDNVTESGPGVVDFSDQERKGAYINRSYFLDTIKLKHNAYSASLGFPFMFAFLTSQKEKEYAARMAGFGPDIELIFDGPPLRTIKFGNKYETRNNIRYLLDQCFIEY